LATPKSDIAIAIAIISCCTFILPSANLQLQGCLIKFQQSVIWFGLVVELRKICPGLSSTGDLILLIFLSPSTAFCLCSL
jgi:hypothetical protein